MRGGVCVGIPLSEEVDCDCLAKCLPLLCEVVIVCIASVRGCIGWREELYTPGCIYPKSSVEVPCARVLCGQR